MTQFNPLFVKGLYSDNPWWSDTDLEGIFEKTPKFTRSDFDHFKAELDQNTVNVLLGPRRCGKTTLIHQIIKHLLKDKKIDPKRILFVSLDRPYYELSSSKTQEIINFYEEWVFKIPLQKTKERVYLFFDEAHYDSLWSRTFKQFVDQKLPVYAIVSGSSAPNLYQDQESGAGRFSIHQMVTLKFRDVIRFKYPEIDSQIKLISKSLRAGLLKSIEQNNSSSYENEVKLFLQQPAEVLSKVKSCVEEYLLKGGYPEFYSTNKSWRDISRHYQTNVFDVILQKDVVTISNIREPEKIRRLLVLVAQNTARQLSRDKIREALNLKSSMTVDQYLNALTSAFLIRTSAKYRSPKSSYPSTKPKKLYCADTGLRNAVLGVESLAFDSEERGKLLETAIFSHVLRLLFHVDRNLRSEGNYFDEGEEVDILVNLERSLKSNILIEVKNGHCGEEDAKKLKRLLQKSNSSFGIIICSDYIGYKNNILSIPPEIFLLSC